VGSGYNRAFRIDNYRTHGNFSLFRALCRFLEGFFHKKGKVRKHHELPLPLIHPGVNPILPPNQARSGLRPKEMKKNHFNFRFSLQDGKLPLRTG
jgi:hypothetical protein